MSPRLCPCGSGRPFEHCCRPLLDGEREAASAEELMRSRYSAYAEGRLDYIDRTYHSSQQKHRHSDAVEQAATRVTWLGLEILATEKGGPGDQQGRVDFIARYAENGVEHAMRERSRFVREQGRWVYLDGEVKALPRRQDKKPGRNDPCPCGSGKKYKKCCA